MPTIANVNVTMPSDCEIEITRLFDAPRSLVYDCYTKPDLLVRWMNPHGWQFAACDNDVRIGGKFFWEWRNAAGETMSISGVYREVARPERVVRTEIFEPDCTGGETLGTLLLAEQDGKTALTMKVKFPSPQARDGALKSGLDQGVAANHARLDALLDNELGRTQSAA
jgi:uncharacterized protein YndB with AHSA1/START domain